MLLHASGPDVLESNTATALTFSPLLSLVLVEELSRWMALMEWPSVSLISLYAPTLCLLICFWNKWLRSGG
jgi:hypothetical protein